MGYRPDNQSLETPARKILDGIEEFEDAVTERAKHGEWKNEHLEEMFELVEQLKKSKMKLITVTKEQW